MGSIITPWIFSDASTVVLEGHKYIPNMNHFSVFMEIEVFTATDIIFLVRVTGYWKKYTHTAILKLPEQMCSLEKKLGLFTLKMSSSSLCCQ